MNEPEDLDSRLTDILDELVMQGATYIDELFKNPYYRKAHKEALAQLKAVFLEVVGDDEVLGKSRIIWESGGGVKAESADDLQGAVRNQLRAEIRRKLGEKS